MNFCGNPECPGHHSIDKMCAASRVCKLSRCSYEIAKIVKRRRQLRLIGTWLNNPLAPQE